MDTNITPDHSLVALLAQVPDFRRDDERAAHLLVDILTIAVCAVLCGANAWTEAGWDENYLLKVLKVLDA